VPDRARVDLDKDYAALAAAEVARHTISNDNVYGFEPEGQYSQTLPLLDTRKESVGTVYRLADQKNAYDWVDVTVDETGTIIRLQFFKRPTPMSDGRTSSTRRTWN